MVVLFQVNAYFITLSNPISCSSDSIELINFNVSTFNTSIHSCPWSLVHAMTVVGIISKQFLVSNVPLKVPNVLMIVPSNCFSCKPDFFKPRLF